MHYKETKSILSSKNGMNLYRGCTHGCIYCDSRSTCYQIQHAFEDIEVKVNAPELLEQVLRNKRKKCMIGTGSMSDPYIHLEEELLNTRKCLEIIERYGFGLVIQTKSNRILRDLDLLKSIHQKAKCVVQMTMTTYDEELCRIVEPAVSTTKERFEVLKILQANGIPTVVWLTPLLPYINDTEDNLRGILDYCIDAKVYGIICFAMGLTLRDGSRQYYYHNLDKHFPGLKEKYRKEYGASYELLSDNHKKLEEIFYQQCQQHDIICDYRKIFNYMSTYEEGRQYKQISLF